MLQNPSSESNRAPSLVSHSGRSPEKHRYQPIPKRMKQETKPQTQAVPKLISDQYLDEERKRLTEYGLHSSLVVQIIGIYKSSKWHNIHKFS